MVLEDLDVYCVSLGVSDGFVVCFASDDFEITLLGSLVLSPDFVDFEVCFASEVFLVTSLVGVDS